MRDLYLRHSSTQKPSTMIAATSSFAGVQLSAAAAAPKASVGRSAILRVEARRTKASAPSRSAVKVRRAIVISAIVKYPCVALCVASGLISMLAAAVSPPGARYRTAT